jgi:type IV secretion system protein VirD4
MVFPRFSSKTRSTFGSARWADRRAIASAGLFAGRGVMLGQAHGRYLRHEGPEHVLIAAPTRSGKGASVVVPTLLSWTGSALIHDIKGENWQITAGWRSRFSHCLSFNPADPRSARYNPLLEVRRGDNEVRDVQTIADILVDPEGGLEQRSHWEKTAHAFLTGLILHVLYAEKEKTLARVSALLADPERPIDMLLRIMLATNHLGDATAPKAHPVVAAAARDLLNKAENERSGVVSTAVSLLTLYRDPLVADVTNRSDWRIADLVYAASPVSLYLIVSPSDLARTRPLIRLILNQIVRRLTESLDAAKIKSRRPLLLMLDEFPALGRLDFFEGALAFLAGYNIRACLIAQSLNQIDKAYGVNNAILDNCHIRVVFAPNDERTAKRLSEALGTATEQRTLRGYTGSRASVWFTHASVSEQETPRSLLTPGEILQLPKHEALILVSGCPPIKARKLRYFEDENFRARCLAPPQLGTGVYADAPPMAAHDWEGRRAVYDGRLDPDRSSNVVPLGRHKTSARPPSKPNLRQLSLLDAHRDDDLDLDATVGFSRDRTLDDLP